MKVTIVGNSGSYPGPGSAASCYLVSASAAGREYHLLLDLGNGALGALHRHLDPALVDGVLISHLHADHCMDLCGYYVLRKYHPDGAMPQIPVWGPKGTARRLARAYGLAKDPGMGEEFDFRRYPDASFQLGPFTITARRVTHPVRAYSLRIEANGRVLAYSGDTGVCQSLVENSRAADLFLCEASFLESIDNPPDLHLTGAEAAQMASQAGVERLLLTHIPPWHDSSLVLAEARAAYSGTVSLAEVGRTYEV
ncbi:MAG TPA: MBL fold metallo-hydrolase [Marmoricola sp.]|nr:MBL fold metallo-hydrolase [Marmoricola sp.]HNO40161.1 MBL fold metallo-hydrolase [Marmoricola sp.]